jgi:acetyl/propionyl-CoA carboxylase alpha subunit
MAVSSAFDPMLAKLIVHGEDREQALERAGKALEETTVLGVTTNVDYLRRVVSHPDFVSGRVHTAFIHSHEADLKPSPLSASQRGLLLAAAALGSREFTDPEFGVLEPYSSIGSWRN